MEEINWKEELLESARFNSHQWKLLKFGARNHMQSMYLHYLYCRWRKTKGYREPPRPDCQSSFKDWSAHIK